MRTRRPVRRWENNIEIDYIEIKCDYADDQVQFTLDKVWKRTIL